MVREGGEGDAGFVWVVQQLLLQPLDFVRERLNHFTETRERRMFLSSIQNHLMKSRAPSRTDVLGVDVIVVVVVRRTSGSSSAARSLTTDSRIVAPSVAAVRGRRAIARISCARKYGNYMHMYGRVARMHELKSYVEKSGSVARDSDLKRHSPRDPATCFAHLQSYCWYLGR